MSRLAEDFRAIGLAVDTGPQGFVRIHHRVPTGRYVGQTIEIALIDTDYPRTPPAGVHLRAPWGADRANVSSSPLGGDWRYWSRRLTRWAGKRAPHAVIAYINKVLADA